MQMQVALLFLITAALYWSTATQANTFDAIAYANQIGLVSQSGRIHGLFHPHHLLFNLIGFSIWRLARMLGYGGGPLVVLQQINATVGAAGVTVFFLLLRRFVPRRLAWMATALLIATFGWWNCATDGRVNMISSVLLLAAFGLLERVLRAPNVRGVILVGAVSGAAVLFHESAVLFLIVGLAGMILASPQGRLTRCLTYSGVWLTVVVVPYLFVGSVLLHLHSWTAYHHWANAYSEQGEWWDFHIARNLRLDLVALHHVLLANPLGQAALEQAAPSLGMHPFCLRVAAITLTLLDYIATACFVIALMGIAATLPRLWHSRHRTMVGLSLLWIAVTGAFFTVWCPGYFAFWVPLLPPLLLLLAMSLVERRSAGRKGLLLGVTALWIILCAVVNITCSILPSMQPGLTLVQRLATDARAHTRPNTLLIVPGAGVDAPTEVGFAYYANRPCLSVHEFFNQSRGMTVMPTAIQVSITHALQAGRKVYAYTETWDDPVTVRALIAHHPGLTQASIASVFSPFRMVPAWNSPRGPVIRLRLQPQPIKNGQPVPDKQGSGQLICGNIEETNHRDD